MSSNILNRLIVLLIWAGVYIAGTIAITEIIHIPMHCGSTGCEVVHTIKLKILKIPIVYYGLACYLFLAGVTALRFFFSKYKKLFFQTTFFVSGTATLISIALIAYTVFGLKSFCIWCTSSAVTFTLIFICHFLLRKKDGAQTGIVEEILFFFTMIAAIGIVALNYTTAIRKYEEREAYLKKVRIEDLLPPSTKIMGQKNADITVLEFGSLYCKSCKDIHQSLKKYKNRIRIAFRHHIPKRFRNTSEIHYQAVALSEVAAKKGKFEAFLDGFFSQNLKALASLDNLRHFAEKMNLNLNQIDQQEIKQCIDRDLNISDKITLQSTPTFIIYSKGSPPKVATSANIEYILSHPPYSNLLLTHAY